MNQTTRHRPPAVSGLFYPADAATLAAQIDAMLAEAARLRPGLAALAAPKALIVPHAGYIYSGPVAAAGYARPASHAGQHRRLVLLGPGHPPGFRGQIGRPPGRERVVREG